jgi:hypothetical protein
VIVPAPERKVEAPVEAAALREEPEEMGEQAMREEELPEGDAPASDAPWPTADGQVEIVYREDLRGLKTEEISLDIDGQAIARKSAAANQELMTAEGLTVFTGILPEGVHNVRLRVKMRGDGTVFRYLENYSFNVTHAGVLSVDEEQKTRVMVTAIQRPGITREWTDKVDLRVDVSRRDVEGDVATLKDR